MSFIKEFKAFAVRGNVMDMAVGIIIGAAFGKIVSSFVNDIIMPPIGVLVGGINFADLKFMLSETASINYGSFFSIVIDFIIIAVVIFLVIKAMNQLQKKEEAKPVVAPPPPAPTTEEKLLTEIRDLLKNKS